MTVLAEHGTAAQPHTGMAPAAGLAGSGTIRTLLTGAFRKAMLEHLPLALVVAVYTFAGWIGWAVLGIQSLSPPTGRNPLSAGFSDVALLGGGMVLACQAARVVLWDTSGGGLLSPRRWSRLESGPLSLSRTLAAGIALVLFSTFFDWFIAFKRSIPLLRPFSFDPALAAVDHALHLGNDPWTLLHPLLGHAGVTAAIQVVYVPGWFGLLFVSTVVMAWHPDRRLSARFFIASVMQWIVAGTLLAALFSSAGPCYFEAVTGSDRFAPLMQYLQTVGAPFGPTAPEIQHALWSDHADGALDGYGVSAMPSMHVATAALLALLGWRLHRGLGTALGVFAAVILVGSVHLGWHYALDGYVAIAATLGIWWAAGRIVDAYDQLTGAFSTGRGA